MSAFNRNYRYVREAGATAVDSRDGVPYMRTSRGRVLVIEDDQDMQRLLSLRLRRDGLQVLASGDGEDGFKIAVESEPDLILVDLLLPSLDGFGVLRALNAVPCTATIPVVVMTSLSRPEYESRARQSGAVLKFLRKPIEPSRVSQIVSELLDRGAF